jgi:type IV pilus assembly protein PilC
MATATAAAKGPKEFTFAWEGKDKTGKPVRGELRAPGEAMVNATLRRQGIVVSKVKKQASGKGGKVGRKDIALFTRQLATMMKAGVPLLQSFDIVGKGAPNPAVGKLVYEIKTEVETGSSLAQAFRKYPLYFDQLFCNLVQAGEQAGILETLLDRLATYQEKILAIQSKIKSALFYPIAIIVGGVHHHRSDHDLRDSCVQGSVLELRRRPARADAVRHGDLGLLRQILVSDLRARDRRRHRLPAGMEALPRGADLHGPPDAEDADVRRAGAQIGHRALDAHAVDDVRGGRAARRGARFRGRRLGQLRVRAGDQADPERGLYRDLADQRNAKRQRVSFDGLQMVSIGEETGALDGMLSKVADFYEAEVDDAVEALSSLMEPVIMVVLGTLIGGMVIAMYLPIFKMGQAV